MGHPLQFTIDQSSQSASYITLFHATVVIYTLIKFNFLYKVYHVTFFHFLPVLSYDIHAMKGQYDSTLLALRDYEYSIQVFV